ncbi:hypothetical protein O181_031945 [Austropuccinia psidii MF-1]|uniref:Integrase catalytic domain-containing protein n=1 Tax=Austropuccinia psidii MF-1 TaxID=1389203 RepID=A0A9Q3D045_9BASI|nr:hypothetical protein [Austropuccinia psidii MF-1]
MIQIQETKSPWEIADMDWVTALPPGGSRSFNSFLVLGHRYRKTTMALPCHKDYIAMETAIIIWNRVISYKGLFQNIISDRDPKFTSELRTNLHSFLEKNYNSQQLTTSELWFSRTNDTNFRRRDQTFCSYGLEFQDSNGCTHDWCTLIPSLEL